MSTLLWRRWLCGLCGHRWSEEPFPPRIFEGWAYDHLPYLIDDPLIWDLAWDRCDRCPAFRWRFISLKAAQRYEQALAGLMQKIRVA